MLVGVSQHGGARVAATRWLKPQQNLNATHTPNTRTHYCDEIGVRNSKNCVLH